jgi:uncharacterized protein (DUF169 family)
MAAKKHDFSVLDKFDFERKPVGVKFVIEKPKGINKPGKPLNMCEMLQHAQEGNVFYVGEEDLVCVGIEQMILGMKDPEPILVSGGFGGEDGLFKENNACRAMYDVLPTLPKGSVRYVVFGQLDKLAFDPDLVVMTANVNQAQTLLRCINYSTGMPFVSKAEPVVACAWLFVYPVVSAELNYFITGLGMGMQAMNIFPPGLFLISVPFQKFPVMLENLAEMGYDPNPPPGPGGVAHRKRVDKLKADVIKRMGL